MFSFMSLGALAGCGGGDGTATTQMTPASVSSGQGSVSAAISAVETSLLSSSLRLGGSSQVLSINASASPGLDNCVESSSGSGEGFTVVCYCVVDGAASGTITTTFGSGRAEAGCQGSDGASGVISAISGSFTVAFDGCALDGCGERISLSGAISGTISYSYNGCTQAETLDATLGTAEACAGLTVTHAEGSSDTLGFSATWSAGQSGGTQGGSACIDGETTDLEGLDAICEEQSGGSCSAATVPCASDFACQLFADDSPNDAFNTDNVACVAGCCVVSETGRCSDGEDNDFDGNTDCADTDCADDPYCVVGPCGSGTVSCANDFACQVFADTDLSDQFTTNNVSCVDSCCVAIELYETGKCTDSTDNDQDSAADCADTDCAGDLACGARLPCTNEWQCRALVSGTEMAFAAPTCIRYDVSHAYYRYNDGSCEYDCKTAAAPDGCLNACLPLARTMQHGGFLNYSDKICRFYPPPH